MLDLSWPLIVWAAVCFMYVCFIRLASFCTEHLALPAYYFCTNLVSPTLPCFIYSLRPTRAAHCQLQFDESMSTISSFDVQSINVCLPVDSFNSYNSRFSVRLLDFFNQLTGTAKCWQPSSCSISLTPTWESAWPPGNIPLIVCPSFGCCLYLHLLPCPW